MAIEKRTRINLDGKTVEVGYNTERKCYCPLPADMKYAPVTTDYHAFTNAQLVKLAEEQGIDLGEATRKDDMIAKIKEHFARQEQ